MDAERTRGSKKESGREDRMESNDMMRDKHRVQTECRAQGMRHINAMAIRFPTPNVNASVGVGQNWCVYVKSVHITRHVYSRCDPGGSAPQLTSRVCNEPLSGFGRCQRHGNRTLRDPHSTLEYACVPLALACGRCVCNKLR